ncbi:MAG TPA: response regulator [Verrucomicrobiae bacterium]
MKKAFTILVIDDEPSVRSAVSLVLGKASMRVLQADGATAARKIWEKQADEINLLLVDISMPQMTGPEFVHELFAAKAGASVIFMSGLGRGDMLEATIDVPHLTILQKPFAPRDLLQMIENQCALAVA